MNDIRDLLYIALYAVGPWLLLIVLGLCVLGLAAIWQGATPPKDGEGQ
ncbi:hypothetical protein BH09VER1_BH09VER1_24890 [soil metagenome]